MKIKDNKFLNNEYDSATNKDSTMKLLIGNKLKEKHIIKSINHRENKITLNPLNKYENKGSEISGKISKSKEPSLPQILSSKDFSANCEIKVSASNSNYNFISIKENSKDKFLLNNPKSLLSVTKSNFNNVTCLSNPPNALHKSIYNFMNLVNNSFKGKNSTADSNINSIYFNTNNNYFKMNDNKNNTFRNINVIENKEIYNEKQFKKSSSEFQIDNCKKKNFSNLNNNLNSNHNDNCNGNRGLFYYYDTINNKNKNINSNYSSNHFRSNYNLEDYSDSNLNKYQVERKHVFKSLVGKNNEHTYKNQNSLNKNNNYYKNENNLVFSNPLKNSLTIQKLDTPPQNKNSNRGFNLKGFNSEFVRELNNGCKSSFNFILNNAAKDSKAYLNRLNNNVLDENKFKDLVVTRYNNKKEEGKIYENEKNLDKTDNKNCCLENAENEDGKEIENKVKTDHRRVLGNSFSKKFSEEFMEIKTEISDDELEKENESSEENKDEYADEVKENSNSTKKLNDLNREIKKDSDKNMLQLNKKKTNISSRSFINTLNKTKKLNKRNPILLEKQSKKLVEFPIPNSNLNLSVALPNSSKYKIFKKICGRSKTGRHLDSTEKANNQDSFLVKSRILENENFSLVAVFDGHGPQGHYISGFLRLFFAEFFSRSELFKEDKGLILPCVHRAFESVFSDLTTNSGFDFICDNNKNGIMNNLNNNYNCNRKFESMISKEISNHFNNHFIDDKNNLFANNNSNVNSTYFSNTSGTSTNNTNNAINTQANTISNYITGNASGKQTSMNVNNNNSKNSTNKLKNCINFKSNRDINNNSSVTLQNIYYSNLCYENHSLIKSSFSLAESTISLSKFDSNFSGSTGICVFIVENRIICANCGDSRAILVASDPNKKSLNCVIPLSTDHKPELPAEAERILGCNGRIDKRFENGVKSGPLRIWLRNEAYPGLAMTRSIGDLVASKIGVTCEPQIFECELTDESKFIVLATDGVWEVLTNDEVAGIINAYYGNLDVESATEKLVEEAAKRWKKEGKTQDDITAVVVFLSK